MQLGVANRYIRFSNARKKWGEAGWTLHIFSLKIAKRNLILAPAKVRKKTEQGGHISVYELKTFIRLTKKCRQNRHANKSGPFCHLYM